jgi:hypothetical protein
VGAAFSKTGWSKETVAEYAAGCDTWKPFGEKEIFSGWAAIGTYTSFQSQYLTYAKAGSKTISRDYWVDMNGQEVPAPKPGEIIQGITRQHKEKTYNGEELFGVLLHKVADCSVPLNHSPANEWCSSDGIGKLDEAAFEALATWDPVPNNSCQKYSIVYPPQEPYSISIYWNLYCQAFEDDMKVNAQNMCAHIAESWWVGSTSGWISEPCFEASVRLANVVLVEYIINSKEYLQSTEVTGISNSFLKID